MIAKNRNKSANLARKQLKANLISLPTGQTKKLEKNAWKVD
jgi:hypothetical protein